MHFHLPKPVHGWRALLGEVGIIVIGVLIALGAEQVIERWRDRERADRSVQALRSEVRGHDFAAAEIEEAAPCILAQIDGVVERLKAGDGEPLTRFYESKGGGYVIRIPDRPYDDATWQSVNGNDVLRRLDPARADGLSSYYSSITLERDSNHAALGRVASLNTLANLMPRGEEERMRFLEQAEHLRSDIGEMDLVAGQLRDRLAAVGMSMRGADLERKLANSGTLKFCRAHGLRIAPLRPADPKIVS